MKKFLMILMFCVFSTGCSTIGTKLVDEHATTHNIQINFSEKNKSVLKYANVSHRLYENQVVITISGTIRKPWGTFASRAIVNAKFLNKDGQILSEEKEKISLHRFGGRNNRRQEGSFLIQVPDNADVNVCSVEIQWI